MTCERAAVVLALASMTLPACTEPKPNQTTDPVQLAALLENRTQRDAAACQLVELGRYRTTPRYNEEGCKEIEGEVNHVIAAPQADRSSIFVVFRNFGERQFAPATGTAKGGFTLIDDQGYIVPVYGGANFLNGSDDIFAYAGDTRLAIAHVIRHGSGQQPRDWTAQALHVVPVLPAQQSVLTVVMGPPLVASDPICAGFYWSWRRRDPDNDGVPEIEIGPRLNDAGDILPRAVYRWSNETGRYDGPVGSVESGFVRLDTTSQASGSCCPYSKGIAQFVTERLKLPIPGDPGAVRRDDCDAGSTIVEY